MDDRWTQEKIDNWVSDFLIDDAGDRVDPALAPHAQEILATFLRHSCSVRQVAPDAIEEEDIRAGLLDGLGSLSLPEKLQPLVPQLVGEFLADLQRRGRLAGGETHMHLVLALKDAFLRSQRGEVESIDRIAAKIGRNDRCPCGSGKKYKKCCLHLLDGDDQ